MKAYSKLLGLLLMVLLLLYHLHHHETSNVTKQARSHSARLPPGSYGYPLLGEGLDFLSEGHNFFGNRARLYQCSIIKTHLFLHKTIAMVGSESLKLFYNQSRIIRTPESSSWSHVFDHNQASMRFSSREELTQVTTLQHYLKPHFHWRVSSLSRRVSWWWDSISILGLVRRVSCSKLKWGDCLLI